MLIVVYNRNKNPDHIKDTHAVKSHKKETVFKKL